jgi:hypothetical protein
LVEKKVHVKKQVPASQTAHLKPNLNGRPKGTPNKATVWKEFLSKLGREASDDEKVRFFTKIKTMAFEGDPTCIKLLYDLWVPERPKLREEPIKISLNLKQVDTPDQLRKVRIEVIELVTKGEITLEEAKLLNEIINPLEKSIELAVLEQSQYELEQQQAQEIEVIPKP